MRFHTVPYYNPLLINFSSVPYMDDKDGKNLVFKVTENTIITDTISPELTQRAFQIVADFLGIITAVDAFKEELKYPLCFGVTYLLQVFLC